MTRGQVRHLRQVRKLAQVPSAPLHLFLPIVRLQYPFVALRGHILEARLKDRCLLFRQNRPLEHLLQNLVAPMPPWSSASAFVPAATGDSNPAACPARAGAMERGASSQRNCNEDFALPVRNVT